MIKFATRKDAIIFYTIISVVIVGILGLIFMAVSDIRKMSFSKKDYEYIYSEIEQKYGNGEQFNVVDKSVDSIREFVGYKDGGRKDYNVIGKKLTITGYFDSQPNIYIMTYVKYKKDQEIVQTLMFNDKLKEEYLDN